ALGYRCFSHDGAVTAPHSLNVCDELVHGRRSAAFRAPRGVLISRIAKYGDRPKMRDEAEEGKVDAPNQIVEQEQPARILGLRRGGAEQETRQRTDELARQGRILGRQRAKLLDEKLEGF